MVNSRSPSESALSRATRSAHTVRPYDAFSTLHPPTIRPLRVSSAAPTLKPEKGAMARWRASRAAATSRSESLNDALKHGDELVPHAAGGLDHLFFGQRLRQDSGGHVRDAGNAEHLDAHVSRHDRLGHGRHPDGIGAH